MKIEEYAVDSFAAYIKAERYVNDGSPSRFSEENTPQIGAPKSPDKNFDIELVRFDNDIKYCEVGDPVTDFPKHVMLVHPDMIKNRLFTDVKHESYSKVNVYPTASGRTVFDLERKFFYKLAYIGYLGRIIRHMEYDRLASAKEATDLLMAVADGGKANAKFSLLREDRGRVVYLPFDKNNIDPNYKIPEQCIKSGSYEWGVLFREFEPYPYIDKTEYIMPFFSLFGGEFDPEKKEFKSDHEIFASQIFRKQKKSLERFLLDDILFPLYNTYFDCLLYGGVELEPHAQNMLFTITDDYKIHRIVCRDLESAGRDIDLMKYLGIEYKTDILNYKCNYRKPKEPDQKYDKYTITHSFMFDFKLGEYIVTPLLNKMKTIYPMLNMGQIAEELKGFNRKFIKQLPPDFFPPDWCYYENINWEATGQKRVYIWNEHPKYR